jgi:3-hydroxyisobutyrate dehydrogenase
MVRIGFIGLGQMGSRMAPHLLPAATKGLAVFDVSSAAVSALVARGAQSSSPAAIARECDVVFTMLPSSPHVTKVYDTLLSELKSATSSASKLLVDCSTIDVATAVNLSRRVTDAGAMALDAPVSGGIGGAEKGTLTFMVGGEKKALDTAMPYLSKMGKNVVHCGGFGTGQAAKIANNLVLGISMIAVSEGMNLGTRLGVDPQVLAGIFNTSSARCWSSDTYNPYPGVMQNVPSSREYEGGFGTDLMLKDLGLAVDAAKESKTPLTMGGAAQQLYQLASAKGWGKKDFSSVLAFMRERKD